MRNTLLAVISGLLFLLPACSASTSGARNTAEYNRILEEHGSPVPPDVATLPEFTPDIVVDAFTRNQKEADAMYGNTWMKVRGTLVYGPTNEGFDGLNVYYVGLENQGKRMAFLFFGARHQEQLADLTHGQTLVIVGVYTPNEKYNPKLIGCTLVSAE